MVNSLRTRRLVITAYAFGGLLTVVGGAVAYLTRATLFTFEPTPIQMPVTITPGWSGQAPFDVQHRALYEVQFDCENPSDLRPPDYRAWDHVVESASIRWEVWREKHRVANGSSETYPENSYGRFGGAEPPRSGREIGTFPGEAGTRYVLRVFVDGGDEMLNQHRPRVNLQLNGQELSDLSNVDEVRELLFPYARGAALLGLIVLALGASCHVVLRRRAA